VGLQTPSRLATSSTAVSRALTASSTCSEISVGGGVRSVLGSLPSTHQPVQVPNDNYVNPGYNYDFLRDPPRPYAGSKIQVILPLPYGYPDS